MLLVAQDLMQEGRSLSDFPLTPALLSSLSPCCLLDLQKSSFPALESLASDDLDLRLQQHHALCWRWVAEHPFPLHQPHGSEMAEEESLLG